MAQHTSDVDAVASSADFVGRDTTSRNARDVDIFRDLKNHATAASTILVYSANEANFQPSEQPAKNLAPSYMTFMKKVTSFPGFGDYHDMVESVHLNNSAFQFEASIRHLMRHDDDCFLIARGLRDLLPGYIPDSSLKTWLLSYVMVSKPDHHDDVNIKFARVILNLKAKEHITMIPEQTAKFELSEMHVNGKWLSHHADSLASKLHPIASVHKMMDFFTSSKDMHRDRLDDASCGCSSSRLYIQDPLNGW